jgi:hypothetical protein
LVVDVFSPQPAVANESTVRTNSENSKSFMFLFLFSECVSSGRIGVVSPALPERQLKCDP